MDRKKANSLIIYFDSALSLQNQTDFLNNKYSEFWVSGESSVDTMKNENHSIQRTTTSLIMCSINHHLIFINFHSSESSESKLSGMFPMRTRYPFGSDNAFPMLSIARLCIVYTRWKPRYEFFFLLLSLIFDSKTHTHTLDFIFSAILSVFFSALQNLIANPAGLNMHMNVYRERTLIKWTVLSSTILSSLFSLFLPFFRWILIVWFACDLIYVWLPLLGILWKKSYWGKQTNKK